MNGEVERALRGLQQPRGERQAAVELASKLLEEVRDDVTGVLPAFLSEQMGGYPETWKKAWLRGRDAGFVSGYALATLGSDGPVIRQRLNEAMRVLAWAERHAPERAIELARAALEGVVADLPED